MHNTSKEVEESTEFRKLKSTKQVQEHIHELEFRKLMHGKLNEKLLEELMDNLKIEVLFRVHLPQQVIKAIQVVEEKQHTIGAKSSLDSANPGALA